MRHQLTAAEADQAAALLEQARADRDRLTAAAREFIAAASAWSATARRWSPLFPAGGEAGDLKLDHMPPPHRLDLAAVEVQGWLTTVEQQPAHGIPAPWPLLEPHEYRVGRGGAKLGRTHYPSPDRIAEVADAVRANVHRASVTAG